MHGISAFLFAVVMFNAGRYLGIQDGRGKHENFTDWFKDYCMVSVVGLAVVTGLNLLLALMGIN